MNNIILRSYQSILIEKIQAAMIEHKRIAVSLATGGGKTICFSYIVSLADKKNKKVLVVSNRTSIFDQNNSALQKFGVKADLINPKVKNIPKRNVACSMSQTLRRRIDKPQWREYLKNLDLIILDEAHENFHNFIFEYISDKCWVLGFSGSLCRYGQQKQLGALYSTIVEGISIKELISNGNLVPARNFTFPAPKLDDVSISSHTGDYNPKELSKIFEKNVLYHGVYDNWIRYCKNKKTIIFCVSSTQTIEICKEFVEHGIDAKYSLSGTFDSDEDFSGKQDEILLQFRNNEFKVLVNCGIYVSGFDCPDIECVILSFSTVSLSKYLQCLGRAARPSLNKSSFIALDFGGNMNRLGLYDDDRDWKLWHSTSTPNGIVPCKDCDNCGCLIPVSSKICPLCNFEFPSAKELSEENYRIELEEIINRSELYGNTIQSYVANKKLEGWSNNRILVNLCKANPKNEKKVFFEAIEILRKENNEYISKNYWYMFKTKILNKDRYGNSKL